MRIHVADLPAEGVLIEERLDPLHLKDLAALQENQACTFRGPLAARLRVAPGIDMVHVEGRIEGNARMACSRCLAPAEVPLDISFKLTFARSAPGGAEDSDPEGKELQTEDLGLVPFEGETIDFRDAVQEQVILAIPMQVRCREDCRGLCAGCGVNLNTETCRCARDEVDPRLAILKKLKLKP